ncbi:hypothetical protein [Acidithiobacillus sp.]|uniref:hypothetical protein n=1 Tax=Acidithiobacillus sp. TaxID=1872118 RepID=UPI003CFEA788
MDVRVLIARAASSPTQKIWGTVFPMDPTSDDAAIFYGPGTKLGGSVYQKPASTAISMYNKKIRGEYQNIHQSVVSTDYALDFVARHLLRGIQGGRFVPGIIGGLKSGDPIPDPVVLTPNKQINAAIQQIPTLPWAF